jgi:hypothetical protein
MTALARLLWPFVAGVWLAACASTAPETALAPEPEPARIPWTLAFGPMDAEVARELEPVLAAAVADVERFFGSPFAAPFDVRIDPERAAFDASFPPEWGIERTECWMVASGVAARLELLSPRVWRTEACEHDPDDARHVRELVAHELVHVYHGQHNPSPDFAEVTGIDWFVEGLATHASGQLASGELASAREALEKDAGPLALADAWKGKYRYGISGSLVAFVDHELGREALVGMLDVTSAEELLARIGRGEEELLAGWRVWVLGSR